MKFRIASLFVLFLCLTILPCRGSLPANIPIPSYGTIKYSNITWLHTEGKYIKNELEEIVFLRGAALGGLKEDYPKPAYRHSHTNFEAYVTEPAEYGTQPTLMRIGCNPWSYWLHFTQTQDQTERLNILNLVAPAIDQAVNFCGENNIYAMIDFHGLWREGWGWPGDEIERIGNDPTDYYEWMTFWANRYATRPHVIYELWNEFVPQTWDTVIAPEMCRRIAEINPLALMVVNVDNSGTMNKWHDNPLPYNVVYSWGFYFHHLAQNWYWQPYIDGDYALGYQRLKSHFIDYRHIDYNMPQMCKEFGWLLEKFPPEFPLERAMRDVLEIWIEYGLHWAQWTWWSNPSNYGLCNNDWTLHDPIGTVWAQYLAGFP